MGTYWLIGLHTLVFLTKEDEPASLDIELDLLNDGFSALLLPLLLGEASRLLGSLALLFSLNFGIFILLKRLANRPPPPPLLPLLPPPLFLLVTTSVSVSVRSFMAGGVD